MVSPPPEQALGLPEHPVYTVAATSRTRHRGNRVARVGRGVDGREQAGQAGRVGSGGPSKPGLLWVREDAGQVPGGSLASRGSHSLLVQGEPACFLERHVQAGNASPSSGAPRAGWTFTMASSCSFQSLSSEGLLPPLLPAPRSSHHPSLLHGPLSAPSSPLLAKGQGVLSKPSRYVSARPPAPGLPLPVSWTPTQRPALLPLPRPCSPGSSRHLPADRQGGRVPRGLCTCCSVFQRTSSSAHGHFPRGALPSPATPATC